MPHFYGQLHKTGHPQACKLAHAWNYTKSAFLSDFHRNFYYGQLENWAVGPCHPIVFM